MNERTIWNERQNHPELIVQDIAIEVRESLLRRGVNKWLYARRRIIDLKHSMKETARQIEKRPADLPKAYRDIRLAYLGAYAELQHICKMPRFVIWGPLHKKMKRCDREIVTKGQAC